MTYEYYKDKKGEWRWRLKASNGRIIADSGQGYRNEQDCLAGIDRVKRSNDAEVRREHDHGSVRYGTDDESHGATADEPITGGGPTGSGDEP